MKKTIIISVLSVLLVACGPGDTGDQSVDEPNLPAPTLPPDQDLPIGKDPVQSDKVPPNAGEAFIDSVELLIMESFPIQVRLDLAGSTPTPCDELSWTVEDDGSTLAVTVFTIPPGPATSCIAVLEPFDVSIDLGSWADEARTVTLNGDVVGEFTS